MNISALNSSKSYGITEQLHINMIAIPFFYSVKPTKILAVRGLSQNHALELWKIQPIQKQTKLYYRNNSPILTELLVFEEVEHSSIAKQIIEKAIIKSNDHLFCEFCKDISDFIEILYHVGQIYVVLPQNKELQQMIDQIAQMTIVDGAQIEYILKEQKLPYLSFLNESILNLEHYYYRWKVYSYLMGDGDKSYRLQPYQMIQDGLLWHPPYPSSSLPYPSVMSLKKIKYFSQLLSTMGRAKLKIQEAMSFIVHNSQYAVQIVSMVVIEIFENFRGDFIQYFLLISDVLFNCSSYVFRRCFENILPYVIYNYVLLRQSDTNTEMNEKYSKQLQKLLSFWEAKYVIDETCLKGLRFLLDLTGPSKLLELKKFRRHAIIEQLPTQVTSRTEAVKKLCSENGLPFFTDKIEEAILFLNAILSVQGPQSIPSEANDRNFDGEPLSDREMHKIQIQALNTVCCENLPIQMVSNKNWKEAAALCLSSKRI